MSLPKTSFDVLLIEDDLGDAGLVRIALRKGPYQVRLHHAKDAAEGFAFLRGSEALVLDRAAPPGPPRPDLILLDLNLPGRSGHEVLDELKNDSVLRPIPVVVLSTSDAERDVLKAYGLGANSFVTKPMDAEDFNRVIHGIENYWFGIVQLPVRA